jgi:cell division septation protein DedD
MRNNETGEFELVVGNKQLLSGFFIVVLLFAVAFAMGYVVGQNTQRPVKLAADGGPAGTAANTAADSRPQPVSPVPPAPVSSAPATPDGAAGQQPPPDSSSGPTPQPTTQPAQASQPATERPAAAPASPGIVSSSELPAGSFWQVLAVKPEVAEAMRQTLKDKGFQVSLTPGTNNLTRVLVGPYSDSPSLGRAKTELETAGFRPVRYKRD